jgi:hypothetical protein
LNACCYAVLGAVITTCVLRAWQLSFKLMFHNTSSELLFDKSVILCTLASINLCLSMLSGALWLHRSTISNYAQRTTSQEGTEDVCPRILCKQSNVVLLLTYPDVHLSECTQHFERLASHLKRRLSPREGGKAFSVNTIVICWPQSSQGSQTGSSTKSLGHSSMISRRSELASQSSCKVKIGTFIHPGKSLPSFAFRGPLADLVGRKRRSS